MEDFNVPSPERVALIDRLQEEIGCSLVPKYFWAACYICDMTTLKELVKLARKKLAYAFVVARATPSMALYWNQSSAGLSNTTTPVQKASSLGSPRADLPPAKRQKTTVSSAVSTSPLSRLRQVTALAQIRDGSCCVLSGQTDIKVAHIYPFCNLYASEPDLFGFRHTFWQTLRCFLPEEKVALWERELFPKSISEPGVEIVQNHITLSRNAEAMWKRGAFALKPISLSEDKRVLTVQFFWQKKQTLDTESITSLMVTPFSTQDLDFNNGAYNSGVCALVDRNGHYIKSGDFFELTTLDTTNQPLPSFQLLEMQWFLTRITGMAGCPFAAETDLEEYDSEDETESGNFDPEDDDDVSNHGLEDFQASPLQPVVEIDSPQFLRQVDQRLQHHTEDEERRPAIPSSVVMKHHTEDEERRPALHSSVAMKREDREDEEQRPALHSSVAMKREDREEAIPSSVAIKHEHIEDFGDRFRCIMCRSGCGMRSGVSQC